MTAHPQITWLSGLVSRFPTHPELNKHALRVLSWPLIGSTLANKLTPGEYYKFWNQHYPGFGRPHRDLGANDVTPRAKHRIRKAFENMVTPKRPHLMIKITGWSRIGFLHEIFPDARFIHLVRDGRAVANSMLQVPWWHGWHGPSQWRLGPLSAANQELWETHDQSYVALAGIAWNILTDSVDCARTGIDTSQFLSITYEQLCENPQATLQLALEFCELDWTLELDRMLYRTKLVNANNKWQQELSILQQTALQAVMAERLLKWGYELVDMPAS